jgi:hypothetical protein
LPSPNRSPISLSLASITTAGDPTAVSTRGHHVTRSSSAATSIRCRRAAVVGAAAVAVAALAAGCGTASSSTGAVPSASTSDAASTGTPPPTASGSQASTSGTSTPASGPAAGSHQTEDNPPGDIPDQQVFVAYTAPGAHFSVKVPEGWARSSGVDGVTFTDKLNSITIQEVPAPAALTEADARSQLLPQLAGAVPAFSAGEISSVPRTAGRAVLVTYLGDSAPDPVTNKVVRDAFERYSFWHNGHQATLTLAGPKGADNVDPWRIVTDSLRWLA